MLKALFSKLYVILYIGPKYLLLEQIFYRQCRASLPGNLKKKTVLITGGSKGLGFGAAKRFLQLNCDLIIGCRNVEFARKQFHSLGPEYQSRIKIYPLDLACLYSVKSFANTVNKLEIGVDILVNNAGIMKSCGRHETVD